MVIIILQVFGWTAFLVGAITLGIWLRRHPEQAVAEKTSRILHLLFWLDYGLLGVIGLAYPGLTHYDQLLGIRPLPRQPLCVIIGVILLLPALYLSLVSNRALRQLGQGANAFRLTRKLVEGDIYRRIRNPMSLGFYLTCMALGLLAGSTSITLGTLLGVIPAHIFYLKYFEEFELELRLGQAYRDYKQRVPFLVPKWSSKENSGASS